MAIIGINLDRENPEYTKDDFLFWMPQFTNIEGLDTLFSNLYPIEQKDILFHLRN